MMKIVRIIILSYVVFSLVNCSSSSARNNTANRQQRPTWTRKTPHDPSYYFGIGIADFQNNLAKTKSLSRDRAIADISAQISSNIYSSTVDRVVEKGGWTKEAYESYLRTFTKNEIKNWEIRDTWYNQATGRFWTLASLSKKAYQQQKKEQTGKIIQKIKKDIYDYDDFYNNNNFGNCLKRLCSGYYHSFFLMNTSPKINYIGKKIGVKEALRNRAHELLQNVELEIIKKPKTIINGINRQYVVKIKSTFQSNYNRKIPIRNLPISIFFDNNTKTEYTDSDGIASFLVTSNRCKNEKLFYDYMINYNKIEFRKVVQSVIDMNNVLDNKRNQLSIPTRNLKLYLNSREKIDGYEIGQDREFISKSVREYLSDSINVAFTGIRMEADYILNINANASFSSRVNVEDRGTIYIYKTFGDISLQNPENGEVIFNVDLEPPPKNRGRNEKEAGENALRRAAIDIQEKYLQKLLNYLKK